jgi:hypothetical protein
MLVHCNRHHYPPRDMPNGQLHSDVNIRDVPCDPFLHDHGRLLRLLHGIGWPVLRVHVWHDMLEHPDLVPR